MTGVSCGAMARGGMPVADTIAENTGRCKRRARLAVACASGAARRWRGMGVVLQLRWTLRMRVQSPARVAKRMLPRAVLVRSSTASARARAQQRRTPHDGGRAPGNGSSHYPCPCGWHGDAEKQCTRSPSVVARSQKRISARCATGSPSTSRCGAATTTQRSSERQGAPSSAWQQVQRQTQTADGRLRRRRGGSTRQGVQVRSRRRVGVPPEWCWEADHGLARNAPATTVDTRGRLGHRVALLSGSWRHAGCHRPWRVAVRSWRGWHHHMTLCLLGRRVSAADPAYWNSNTPACMLHRRWTVRRVNCGREGGAR